MFFVFYYPKSKTPTNKTLKRSSEDPGVLGGPRLSMAAGLNVPLLNVISIKTQIFNDFLLKACINFDILIYGQMDGYWFGFMHAGM